MGGDLINVIIDKSWGQTNAGEIGVKLVIV
jgi:hypothetical protein